MAWANGDTTTLNALVNADLQESAPEAYEALVTERNERYAALILGALNETYGTGLVALGAGYLSGPQSIPAIIEGKGIAIERVGGARENSEETLVDAAADAIAADPLPAMEEEQASSSVEDANSAEEAWPVFFEVDLSEEAGSADKEGETVIAPDIPEDENAAQDSEGPDLIEMLIREVD